MAQQAQHEHEPLNEGVVFHVHDVTKVYQMGEVAVHALRGIDLDLFRGDHPQCRYCTDGRPGYSPGRRSHHRGEHQCHPPRTPRTDLVKRR